METLCDRLHAAGQGWQPIETAPHDGTIILCNTDGEVSAGYWCRWAGDPENGFWEVVNYNHWSAADVLFWQPLPDSPESLPSSNKGRAE